MNSNINLAFNNCKKERRPALITYTVAGDNSKTNSLKILNSISKYADICELGFAHNCPIADGSQIQNSSYRALKNGITLKETFDIVKKFKKNKPNKPIILMGYYNLIYQMGENNFLNKCKNAGVDGIIVVDLPWPENKLLSIKCKKKNICFVHISRRKQHQLHTLINTHHIYTMGTEYDNLDIYRALDFSFHDCICVVFDSIFEQNFPLVEVTESVTVYVEDI